MKLHALSLVALCLLLGACNTTRTTAQRNVPPPVLTGTKATVWGELPAYDLTGHKFVGLRPPVRVVTGSIVLDLKVAFDGQVEDVAVFESSGNTDVDRVLVDQFKKARYSLQLRPEDPAPYVVRITMHMNPGAQPGWQPDGHFGQIDAAAHKNLGGPTGPTQGYSTQGP